MRYYELTLQSPTTGQVWALSPKGGLVLTGSTVPAGAPLQGSATESNSEGIPEITINARAIAAPSTFTSHPNGKRQPPNPAALNIEFDLPVAAGHTAQAGSIIRVWGIGLQALGQAAQLAGAGFVLKGGMGAGYPLVNPGQAGVLAQGSILRSFGQWQGVNQTLELVCIPGTSGVASTGPTNGIAFQWGPGQTLAEALFTSLALAYPQMGSPVIEITPLLATPLRGETQAAWYQTFEQFASALKRLTQPLGAKVTGNPNYPGVWLSVNNNAVLAQDFTQPAAPTVIQFTDMIGQPTWIGVNEISFKTVMRSDLSVGDVVTLPNGLFAPYALMTPDAAVPNAPASSRLIFEGTFVISEVHHFANFRQPDAESWSTAFTAIAQPLTTGTSSTAGLP